MGRWDNQRLAVQAGSTNGLDEYDRCRVHACFAIQKRRYEGIVFPRSHSRPEFIDPK